MSRRYRDADFLREQYVEKDRSAPEIAEMCGTSSSTISRWLERRSITKTDKYRRKSWLKIQYVDRGREQRDIAEECDVSESTICHWLARHGITDGESRERGTCETCGSDFRYYPSVRDGQYCSNDCAKEPQKRQVEITCPGCESTFRRRASLETEYCSMSCWSDDYDGCSAHWYGSDWQKQREKAIARDGYECTECGMTDEEHRQISGRGLEVHHVVPIRLFDAWDRPIDDAHALRNLTTLCRTHHPDALGTTEMLAGRGLEPME